MSWLLSSCLSVALAAGSSCSSFGLGRAEQAQAGEGEAVSLGMGEAVPGWGVAAAEQVWLGWRAVPLLCVWHFVLGP